METKVTEFDFNNESGFNAKAKITVTRIEDWWLSSPEVKDVPPDIREALLKWLQDGAV